MPISSWSGEGQNACRQEAKIGRVWNSNKRRDFRVGFWRAFGGPQPARATQCPRRFTPPKLRGRREVQASARTNRGGTSLGPETIGVARVPISSWSGEGQNACRQEAKIGRVWNSNNRRDFRVGFWRAFGGPQPARATQCPRRFGPPKLRGRRVVQASARTTRGGTSLGPETMGVARVAISSWSGEGAERMPSGSQNWSGLELKQTARLPRGFLESLRRVSTRPCNTVSTALRATNSAGRLSRPGAVPSSPPPILQVSTPPTRNTTCQSH